MKSCHFLVIFSAASKPHEITEYYVKDLSINYLYWLKYQMVKWAQLKGKLENILKAAKVKIKWHNLYI